MKTKAILLTLALGALTCLLNAQDGNPPPDGPRPPRREGGPGGPGGPPDGSGGPRGMRPIPMIEALDLNKDGTIDAAEIAKASESLKKLDKNGDGQLTPDEFRPMRAGGPGGAGGRAGVGAPGGPGGRPANQGSQRPPPPPNDQ